MSTVRRTTVDPEEQKIRAQWIKRVIKDTTGFEIPSADDAWAEIIKQGCNLAAHVYDFREEQNEAIDRTICSAGVAGDGYSLFDRNVDCTEYWYVPGDNTEDTEDTEVTEEDKQEELREIIQACIDWFDDDDPVSPRFLIWTVTEWKLTG